MKRILALLAGCGAGLAGCGGDGEREPASPGLAPVATPLAASYDYHHDGRSPEAVAFLDAIERVEAAKGWEPDTYDTSRPEAVAYTVNDGRIACDNLRSASFDETTALFSTGYGPTVYTVHAAMTIVHNARVHLCPSA